MQRVRYMVCEPTSEGFKQVYSQLPLFYSGKEAEP